MKFYDTLTEVERSLIVDALSCEECREDTDPVIVVDIDGNALDRLYTYLGTVAVGGLPAFLGGVMPANRAALETAIVQQISQGRGVVTGRIITGLTAGVAGLVLVDAALFRHVTLSVVLGAANANIGSLYNIKHLVSSNRQPNDIHMTVHYH